MKRIRRSPLQALNWRRDEVNSQLCLSPPPPQPPTNITKRQKKGSTVSFSFAGADKRYTFSLQVGPTHNAHARFTGVLSKNFTVLQIPKLARFLYSERYLGSLSSEFMVSLKMWEIFGPALSEFMVSLEIFFQHYSNSNVINYAIQFSCIW
jgi:hypothetical protein